MGYNFCEVDVEGKNKTLSVPKDPLLSSLTIKNNYLKTFKQVFRFGWHNT